MISDFLRKACTFTYVRFINTPLLWLKEFINIIDFLCNVSNGQLQILFCGRPFYYVQHFKRQVHESRRLIILANGPSLKEDLKRLESENLNNVDYAMLNFSANSDEFLRYKPKYYVLADHVFFKKSGESDIIKDFYRNINEKVDWDMTIILSYNVAVVKQFANLSNPHIKYQRVFSIEGAGPRWFKNWCYKRGYAIPGLGTVTNLAAYSAIQYGYKYIEFCGNDMSLIDGLCVNDDNIPCMKISHYYDNKEELRPLKLSNGQFATLEFSIENVLRMVKAHNAIAEYGKYMGVHFVNRTRKSMLDCYPRLIKIHPEEFDK